MWKGGDTAGTSVPSILGHLIETDVSTLHVGQQSVLLFARSVRRKVDNSNHHNAIEGCGWYACTELPRIDSDSFQSVCDAIRRNFGTCAHKDSTTARCLVIMSIARGLIALGCAPVQPLAAPGDDERRN